MTLKPEGYLDRLLDKKMDSYLRTFGAVYVKGPKNSGKTWMSRNHSLSEIQIDTETLDAVEIDRSIALEGEAPRLIDEWQMVPELWNDVRFRIDRTGKKGQYILCGSYSVSKKDEKRILHSGIGRIAPLELQTMTLYESGDSDGSVSLMDLFDGAPVSAVSEEIGLRHLVHLVSRGGWPSNLDEGVDFKVANRLYLEALCQRDAIVIDGVKRDPKKMMMLIRALARNESKVVKKTTLRNDMKEFDDEDISTSTFDDYISVLEQLNMVWEQTAFDPNLRSSIRVGKNPKRHMADPSLSFSALRMTPESAIADLRTFGLLFEAMCERDLRVYSEVDDGKLFHYRDDRGNEVDAIVELDDGRWGMFEIKLGQNQIDEAAGNLVKISRMFEEKGGRTPCLLCVLCGVCRYAYRRQDGVYVVPITSLRERRLESAKASGQ
ncbi:MAG: ATP-binding protein [Candidatus Methanomethylophilaceae archaeon]|nr:ATP-binding protein [Candidatus Methanomethylophilaceae archaeon]